MTTPNQPETKLEPCPFCGGEASSSGEVKYCETHQAWWPHGTQILEAYFCNCLHCGASNKGMCGHRTREKAIAHWNTRPADPRDTLIEQLAGALENAANVTTDTRHEVAAVASAALAAYCAFKEGKASAVSDDTKQVLMELIDLARGHNQNISPNMWNVEEWAQAKLAAMRAQPEEKP